MSTRKSILITAVSIWLAFITSAFGRSNDIIDFRIVSESPTEIVLEIKYFYDGGLGQTAYMGSAMAQNGQVSKWYAHFPDSIQPGLNKARLKLGVNKKAPLPFGTNQIHVYMYDAKKRRTFYDEYLHYEKTWGFKPSQNVSPSNPTQPATQNPPSSTGGTHTPSIKDAWKITIEGERQSNREVLYLKYYQGQGISWISKVAMFRMSLSGKKEIATGTLKRNNEQGYLELLSKRGSKLEGRLTIKDNFMSGVVERVQRDGKRDKRGIQLRRCNKLSYKYNNWSCD